MFVLIPSPMREGSTIFVDNRGHHSIMGARNMNNCYSTASAGGKLTAQMTITFTTFTTSACASWELAATGGASTFSGMVFAKHVE